MVNGALHPRAGASDLRFQRGDPRFQIGDRQGIEILPGKAGQQVVEAGPGFVGIHGHSVDRGCGAVNNGGAAKGRP